MTRVTVLVPTYNRESLLPACLESIRAQTFTDWKAVVGDNASTDGSVEIVRALDDPRFELVCRSKNIGYVRNTNLLLDNVDTELVAILHSDDWWETDFLARMVDLLDHAPEAIMAICAPRLVFESGRTRVDRLDRTASSRGSAVLTSSDATRMLVRSWAYLTPSDAVTRRELYGRFRFEESLPYTNDRAMWLRAASVGAIATCDEPLANNRMHAQSVFGQSDGDLLWADEGIRMATLLEAEWKENGSPYPGAGRELRTMEALRFVMKSYELHENGNRKGALKLIRLARQNAPSPGWRAVAALQGLFIRITSPGAAILVRRLVARLARRFPRPRRGDGGHAYNRPGENLRWSAGDILRALRESD
jgi:glycosyltransferase involved in cell wall biosynthesis